MFIIIIGVLKHCSSIWAAPSNTVILSSLRFLATACQFYMPVVFPSSSTSSAVFVVIFFFSLFHSNVHCLLRHSVFIHCFNMSITSKSEQFYKFYVVHIFHIFTIIHSVSLICSYSPGVFLLYWTINFSCNLPFKYS